MFTTYPNNDSNTSTENHSSNITYESLANYLDFELPQQHVLNERQIKQPKKRNKIAKKQQSQRILPKITSAEMPDEIKNNLMHFNQNDDSSSTCSSRSPAEGKERSTTEEEKRKRNTAASARFRIKKKQREQEMEKTVEDMTSKSKGLEKRVHELESEIKFFEKLTD